MDEKLDFPATGRNSSHICEVLSEHLPAGNVLEIASGSGQHVVYFADHLPLNHFIPSDPDPAHVRSIAAWIKASEMANIAPPQILDTTEPGWIDGQQPPQSVQAILCINMIHIAPISAAHGLFAGSAKRLSPGGLLYLYGPFLGTGTADAPSNLAFDADLKRRNASWGIRTLGEVLQMAEAADFVFDQSIPMPANNFSLLFRKA